MDLIQINTALLNDPAVGCLTDTEFRQQFESAALGEENALSPYLKLLHSRLIGTPWRLLRASVFARDHYTCRYCGQIGGDLECDHAVPLVRGGDNSMDNLVTACAACNRAKYTKTAAEFSK